MWQEQPSAELATDLLLFQRSTSVQWTAEFSFTASRSLFQDGILPSGPWYGEVLILSIIEFTPLPGKREEVLELLRFSVDRARTRSGCLGAGVYEDGDESQTILYVERWASEEELSSHIRSNCYLGVLNAIDLAKRPPEVAFHKVTSSMSMELIANLRCPGIA